MEILKVKPWGQDQGDHVLINKADYNPEFHRLLDEPYAPEKPKALTVDELRAALAERGIEIPEGAKKADLQALLDEANKAPE